MLNVKLPGIQVISQGGMSSPCVQWWVNPLDPQDYKKCSILAGHFQSILNMRTGTGSVALSNL